MKVTDAGWGTLKDAEGNIYSDDGTGEGTVTSCTTGEVFCISKRDENENPVELIPYYDYDQVIEKIMAEEKCGRSAAERFYVLNQVLVREGFSADQSNADRI